MIDLLTGENKARAVQAAARGLEAEPISEGSGEGETRRAIERDMFHFV